MIPRCQLRGGHCALPGLFLSVLCALLWPSLAGAHDLWLVPSTFEPAAGQPVSVHILVGHDPATAEPLPYRADWVETFTVSGPLGEPTRTEPVQGVPGGDPAGYLRPEMPGVHALALVSGSTIHDLSVEDFRRYLAEEGLERAARSRAGTVYADGSVREAFSRSVKSLLLVPGEGGSRTTTGHDRPLGLPLELVLLTDPFTEAADSVRLRVLLAGEPADGVRVDLRALDPNSSPTEDPSADGEAGNPILATAISDEDGVLSLDLEEGVSRYLVAATVLLPPDPKSGAEWHSLWTSLTFQADDPGS